MEKLMFTSLTPDDLKSMVKEALKEIMQLSPSSEGGKEIMNLDETSQFLDIPKATLYKYTSKRLIPHIKKPKKLIFKKSELLKWLETANKKTLAQMMNDNEGFDDLNSKSKRGRPKIL